MDASLMGAIKAMADENRRLKKMYAEMAMQNELLKDALGKSDMAILEAGDGRSRCSMERRFDCNGLPSVFYQRELLSI